MSSQHDEQSQRAFIDAIAAGNRQQAEKAWKSCPAPGEFTVRRNPLCEAIRTEEEALALWLVELGFDHTGCDLRGTPAAALCVIADLPGVLKKLLDGGESPQRRVNGHLTALMPGPPLYDKLRHVRDFPKNDKFEIFHEGSLLHVAAVTGSHRCAQVLLDAGIDAEAKDSEGRTPAMLALLGGERTRAVLELLPKPDASSGQARDELFKLSLLRADIDGVRNAIADGADVSRLIESQYSPASTPLIIAACQGNIVILQALLDAGADIHQVDSPVGKKPSASSLKSLIEEAGFDALTSLPIASCRTPLGWAALHGRVAAMQLLLQAGADRHAADLFNFTALHLAALGDHPDAVQCLVDSGLAVDAEAFDKMTPMHVAAAADAGQAIAALLAAGADPTRRTRSGETPYVVAKEYGSKAARRVLEPHSGTDSPAKKRPRKEEPAWKWNKEKFQRLVKETTKKYGKAAKVLLTDTFRNQLSAAAKEATFAEAAEALRKKLKAAEVCQSDERPHLRWWEQVAITDAKLLKLQEEFLLRHVFVVSELTSTDKTRRVYVLPTTDLFAVSAAFGINGINMDLTSEATIAWLMDFHRRHPLRLIGIGHDGLRFRLIEPIKEPEGLVDELWTICPPPLEGPNHMRQFRDTLKSETPEVVLWWD